MFKWLHRNSDSKSEKAVIIAFLFSFFSLSIIFFEWIDNGEIIEKGHHSFLVKEAGLYSQMWSDHAKYYTESC